MSRFHESARAQVAGAATYIDDIAEVRGTLHAAPVCSPVAHGVLRGIDPSAALALPGVRPMLMANRPMAAMVTLSLEDSAEDAIRAPVLALALATVRALPPKVAKPAKR